jgi:nitrogen-specific signal transduction histidine kinase/ActR/RegA family two-component response regulator
MTRDLEELERRVRDLEARLVHADKLACIGQMSAGIAHEINNPVAYVLANLTVLGDLLAEIRGEALGEASLQALTSANEILVDCVGGMDRIQRVASDLRLFSRVEYDSLEQVNLNEVVEGALKLADNELRHRARIEKKLAAVAQVVGDASKLSQVVLNLLINAAQAIESGDASHNVISVETLARGTEVLLRVRDTGPGIPESALPRIFDPFFTTKAKGSGTGLGLWLVREIVRMHHGEITARNSHEGTVFELSLPAQIGSLRRSTPAGTIAHTNTSMPARRRARVLLIDDDAALRRALKRMLNAYHTLVEADGGASAIALLRESAPFDAILCDLMMPDIDGPTVHEFVANHRPELVDKLAFLSGGAFTERARDFLERTGTHVIEKPVSREALLRVIDGLAGAGVEPLTTQLVVGASK